MSPGRKVEFLVAGVQKGGTTALFEYLRELPGLQLPEVKEAHFFDDEERVDWNRPDYAPYHGLFVEDGRMWGEATPIYSYWPNSIERIEAYNPAMKIILIFRDPIERAWSHWKMEYAKGKENQPFQWCIREGRGRLQPGDSSAPGHHRVFSYVERGFYGALVERLLSVFPREQCLFLRSDELRGEPTAALRRVTSFLEQTSPGAVAQRLVHGAREHHYPSQLLPADILLLSQIYTADLAHFSRLTGIDVDDWKGNWARSAASASAAK